MAIRNRRFTAAAWLFVGYLIAVILFGAWVRISHSGDGCGSNWPTCHGQVVPSTPSTATLIEFTHRVTSGLCGVFGLGLLVWSWRLFGSGPVTRAMAWTLLLVVFEGAIGAGLVLGDLVADDASAARAVVIALHLTNTLALTAAAALGAWRSAHSVQTRVMPHRRRAFAVGIGLVVLTATSGAVTALGDTLFPVDVEIDPGLFTAIQNSLPPGSHFLVRLRVLHPALAIATAGYLIWLLGQEPDSNGWARAAKYLVATEVVIGFVNVGLSAPGWMQIIHLLAAQMFWVALVLACMSVAPQEGLERAPVRA